MSRERITRRPQYSGLGEPRPIQRPLPKDHIRNNARRYQQLHLPNWPLLPEHVRAELESGVLTIKDNPGLRHGVVLDPYHLSIYLGLLRQAEKLPD